MKKVILNATDKIAYPDKAKLDEFHVRFYDYLVAGLNKSFDEEDRRDAVSAAFSKLISRKGPQDFKGKVPQTEAEWYWCLHWQAKAYLSHLMEKSERFARYQEEEIRSFKVGIQDAEQTGTLGSSGLSQELHEIFKTMCCVCGVNPEHSRIFWDWWIEGEDIDIVAKRYDVKKNNIYQIKSKVSKVLKNQGPDFFADYREAA